MDDGEGSMIAYRSSTGEPRDGDWVFLLGYACPLALSLVLIMLLWNLTLLCKVQFFRDRQVTKLTYLPYILSFSFLIS